MEHRKLIDYSQPAPRRVGADKVLAVLCVVVMVALAAALVIGLRMRGVL